MFAAALITASMGWSHLCQLRSAVAPLASSRNHGAAYGCRAAVATMQTRGKEREPQIVSPRVAIEYCTRCNWMLRSSWMAQELLTTFNGTIGEVALVPNHEIGGIFEVTLLTGAGAELLWSRTDEGRFPESRELKQLVRDELEPDRDLGHSDDPLEEKRDSRSTAFNRLLSILGGDRASRDGGGSF